MYILTSGQMRLAEEACVNREGITYLKLMERAGAECASAVKLDDSPVLILCGKGKNGGDGFVAARYLSEKGFKVYVLLACGKPAAEDAIINFERLDKDKINVIEYSGDPAGIYGVLDECGIVFDCIFGTGFSGTLSPELLALVDEVNKRNSTKIAIDIPSGIDCDRAEVGGTAFCADYTIAISAPKPAHIIKPVCEKCGKIIVADIGITDEEHISAGSDIITLSEKEAKNLLPPRPAVSNKGTYGHALNICGSVRMQGAAVLAAKGALRAGAGLVTAAFPEKAYPAIAAKLTEPLMLPLPCDENGFFTLASFPGLLEALKKASAALIGCGLGQTPQVKELVYSVIREAECPLVIDADGINCAAKNIDILKALKRGSVITPHPGEMSRLTGKSIEEILKEPIKTALKFADEYGITVVLKTANTVVCSPGCPVYLNSTGNTALSKGGSGDLLAGIIVSLMAQGLSAFDAARAGVYFHGLLADRAAGTDKMRQRYTLPSDLADYIALNSPLSER